MAVVISFTTTREGYRAGRRAERAAALITWQQALEAPAMRADLCVVCSTPTSEHFDEQGRSRGCEYAMKHAGSVACR